MLNKPRSATMFFSVISRELLSRTDHYPNTNNYIYESIFQYECNDYTANQYTCVCVTDQSSKD